MTKNGFLTSTQKGGVVILVITHDRDAHGRHMVDLLRTRGKEVKILDCSKFPTAATLTFELTDSPRTSLRLADGTRVDAQSIESILNRRQPEPMAPQTISDARIQEYIVRESRNFLDALPQLIPAFWLNHPDRNRVASRKPYQLLLAKTLGFSVPPTTITNDPEAVRLFVNSIPGDIAIKTLWTPGISVSDKGGAERHFTLYTAKQSREQALVGIAKVQNCPMIFQSYVEKAFELRITVVESRVFSCAIHSQQSEKARHDWRNYDLANTPHKSYQLPTAVEERCIRLVKELDLSFGCIDMIVTPSGEYVFLEINPNGQWLWIEHLTGMPISDAIADLLVHPPRAT